MNKKLLIAPIVLLVLIALRSIYIIKEVKEWEPYVSRYSDYDSLVYQYNYGSYSELFEIVLVNETLNPGESNELYDFAHYYKELSVAYKDKIMGKDYNDNLEKMSYHLNRIKTKDILNKIDELNTIYKLD